ncbi:MAG TPA: hypothetical protein DCY88_03405 [Cyanobacteria bacterium UBA11372]|nr:hypothetical protein [Cyanobacteria bacterium UBA11372]
MLVGAGFTNHVGEKLSISINPPPSVAHSWENGISLWDENKFSKSLQRFFRKQPNLGLKNKLTANHITLGSKKGRNYDINA